MDTILTVVLVFACIALIALSAILLYDLTHDIMEERKAAKKRDVLFQKWKDIDLISSVTKEDFIKNKEISDYVDKIIRESVNRVDNCPHKLGGKCSKTANMIPCHTLITLGNCNAVKGINQHDE